jgi:amidase
MTLNEPASVELKSLRAAFYYMNNGMYPSDQETLQVISNVVDYLKTLGMRINEDCPKGIEQAKDIFMAVTRVRTREYLEDVAKEIIAPEDLNQESLQYYSDIWLDRAKVTKADGAMSSLEYLFWLNKLEMFRSCMLSFMQRYDVIICPTAGKPAMPHGFTRTEEGHAYANTSAFSLTGWPSVVVRAGTSSEGLPINVQIVAGNCRDDIALAVAKAVEDEFGGWKPPAA